MAGDREELFEVVSPVPRAAAVDGTLAAGLSELAGKTICELWDSLFRGDQLFRIVREELAKRFPDVRFVDHVAFGNTHGPNEREVIAQLPHLLKHFGCDIVISGVGG